MQHNTSPTNNQVPVSNSLETSIEVGDALFKSFVDFREEGNGLPVEAQPIYPQLDQQIIEVQTIYPQLDQQIAHPLVNQPSPPQEPDHQPLITQELIQHVVPPQFVRATAIPQQVPPQFDQPIIQSAISQQVPQQFDHLLIPQQFVQPTIPQQSVQPAIPQQFVQPAIPQQFVQPAIPQQFDQQFIQQFIQSGIPQGFIQPPMPAPLQVEQFSIPQESVQPLAIQSEIQLPADQNIPPQQGISCKVSESALSYLQSLLKPFDEMIGQSKDVQALLSWLPMAFPDKWGNLCVTAANEVIEATREHDAKTGQSAPQDYLINVIRGVVVAKLTDEIISSANKKFSSEEILLPWDILEAIKSDSILPKLFNIPEGTNQLPVGVLVGVVPFIHYLDLEFVAGLIAFSSLIAVDFHVTVADKRVDTEILSRVINVKSNPKYSMELSKVKYQFNSEESFIRGIDTAAMWSHRDHKPYWSNYLRIADGTPMMMVSN